jgi:hypothetical protein
MAGSIRDVLQRLHDAGEDVLTLDVVTLTGEISIEKVQVEQDGKKRFRLEDIYEMIQNPEMKANLKVVALTHRGLDRDVATVFGSDLSEAERALLATHKEMYAAAEEARAAIVRLVLQFVR